MSPVESSPAVLFDIDGTLLRAGVMHKVFASLFDEVYGTRYPHPERISFVGATDSALLRRLAAECGIASTREAEVRFFAAIGKRVDEELAKKPPLVFPGVPDLLQSLSTRAALGLVTGNSEVAAWVKLRHGGLDRFFTFGAYGSEAADRDDIARLAQSRAPGRVVALAGDTPFDIRAAHAIGAKAIAVRTGWCSREELLGADAILDDFADLPKALKAFGV